MKLLLHLRSMSQKLRGVFNELDKYGVAFYEEQMLDHLLDKICLSPC